MALAFLFRATVQLFNLIEARLVDQKLLIILDIEQVGNKVSEAHCAQEMVQTQLLHKSLPGFNEYLVALRSIFVPLEASTTAAARFIA